MTNPSKRDETEKGKQDGPENADLSARLASLDARLSSLDAQREKKEKPGNQAASNSGAVGQGLKLSAEFVSGILAGGIAGWVLDWLFGWSPWGMVVCLLLGFCAGMLNMLRAAGIVKTHHDRDRS